MLTNISAIKNIRWYCSIFYSKNSLHCTQFWVGPLWPRPRVRNYNHNQEVQTCPEKFRSWTSGLEFLRQLFVQFLLLQQNIWTKQWACSSMMIIVAELLNVNPASIRNYSRLSKSLNDGTVWIERVTIFRVIPYHFKHLCIFNTISGAQLSKCFKHISWHFHTSRTLEFSIEFL